MSDEPLVILVDDDSSVRKALSRLFRKEHLEVLAFDSGEALLAAELADRPTCLVLDLQLLDKSGLDVQESLLARGIDLPTVFITAYGDVSSSVAAMKRGAVDFIEKPPNPDELLKVVRTAIENDREGRRHRGRLLQIREHMATLTERELEVMTLVAEGLLNKQIADKLGIAEATIKIHRARVMAKMKADSLAELVRMVSLVNPEQPQQ